MEYDLSHIQSIHIQSTYSPYSISLTTISYPPGLADYIEWYGGANANGL